MPDDKPLDLSLVVPCYNEAPHLRRCVASLVQTLDDLRYEYEIIFVEDRSSDDTLSILRDLCATLPRCKLIANEVNRGRGGAFKVGFAASRGRIVGFLDIDLEIGPHYIAPVVARIEHHGADMALATRTNALTSPRAAGRAFVSRTYQLIEKMLLGLDVTDTESGCKFFKRETAAHAVECCEFDGWFFDTEVVTRALLLGLRVDQVPVLFVRGYKASTVRLVPDTIKQLRDMHQFRKRVGMALSAKSPVYWSTAIYDRAMDELCGPYEHNVLSDVANRIPGGASVVDLCCGTARIASTFLLGKGCSYLGLDFNGSFIVTARRRGLDVRYHEVLRDEIPIADYVIMCSSLYHFHGHADELLAKMAASARKQVIISEPVVKWGNSVVTPRLRHWLTNAGIGDAQHRYDARAFEALARKHGAVEFAHKQGDRNAVAAFPGRAAAATSADIPAAAEPPRGSARPHPSQTRAAR